MIPTQRFTPFGDEGPKILLFGKQTGDWNPTNLQDNYQQQPGLYSRFSQVAARNHVSEIQLPTARNCNARIVSVQDYPVSIHNGATSVILKRGVEADGMILLYGQAGAIASADCPTIVVYCPVSRSVVMAHSGFRSIQNGVVEAVADAIGRLRFNGYNIFVTCGIGVEYYERVDVAASLPERECVVGNNVDLRKLIAARFRTKGIGNVLFDSVDTYGEVGRFNGETGRHVWHSYRRAKTPAEKMGRNLVLVVNK